MQTSFLPLYELFLFAVPPVAPLVGASDIGRGSYGPANRRWSLGIEPQTHLGSKPLMYKKIALHDTRFEPRTYVKIRKKIFHAQSGMNPNIHVERVCVIHMEYGHQNNWQRPDRLTMARLTEILDFGKRPKTQISHIKGVDPTQQS